MNLIQKLTNWYFTKDALPYWCVFLFDSLMTFFAGLVVFWAYHRTGYNIFHFWGILNSIVIYVIIAMIGFRLFKTYSGMMRYSSFVDLQRIAYANAFSLFVAIIVHYPMYKLPRPTFEAFHLRHLVVMFGVSTMLMWAGRVLMKELYEISRNKSGMKNVLIYGIKEGGVGLAKAIRNAQPTEFRLRGFISHEKDFKGHLLMGVNIFQVDELKEAIQRFRIKAVLVSPQRNNEFRNDSQLQSILTDAGVKIYMSHGYTEGMNPENVNLKEVSIDDLLPRDEIKVDLEGVSNMLRGQKILITGSAGSIGSELVRQIALFAPSEMMLIDQAETPEHDIRLMMAREFPGVKAETLVTSICHNHRMESVFGQFRPDYVFHAAAYKHVPMMEDNPCEAVLNNVYGTKVVADLSVKYGVKKFVMISTDKAVNPTNVMGCSKRICEIYCQSLNKAVQEKQVDGVTHFVTTRFGNVLGSNGSVIPIFREQIKNGGPVTVTDERIVRFFMLIPEACKLVLEAGTMGHGGEIFVFDMGKPVRIVDLAKRMISLSGAKNIKIEFTGLREGEKLYEEVLNEMEGTKPTYHDKIRIASVREYDYEAVNRDIEDLLEISRRYDNMDIVRKMKEMVPEYKSNNSVYSVLDENH